MIGLKLNFGLVGNEYFLSDLAYGLTEEQKKLAGKVVFTSNTRHSKRHVNYNTSALETAISHLFPKETETIGEGKNQQITGFLGQPLDHFVYFVLNPHDDITIGVTTNSATTAQLYHSFSPIDPQTKPSSRI